MRGGDGTLLEDRRSPGASAFFFCSAGATEVSRQTVCCLTSTRHRYLSLYDNLSQHMNSGVNADALNCTFYFLERTNLRIHRSFISAPE